MYDGGMWASRPTDYVTTNPYSSSEAQLSFVPKEATPSCSLNYSAVCRISKAASPYPAPPVYQNWRLTPEPYFVTQNQRVGWDSFQ